MGIWIGLVSIEAGFGLESTELVGLVAGFASSGAGVVGAGVWLLAGGC